MGRSVRNGVGRFNSGVPVGRIPEDKAVDVEPHDGTVRFGPSNDDMIVELHRGTYMVNTSRFQRGGRKKT